MCASNLRAGEAEPGDSLRPATQPTQPDCWATGKERLSQEDDGILEGDS